MNMKKSGNNYQVHLTAQNQKRSVAELYITIYGSEQMNGKNLTFSR